MAKFARFGPSEKIFRTKTPLVFFDVSSRDCTMLMNIIARIEGRQGSVRLRIIDGRHKGWCTHSFLDFSSHEIEEISPLEYLAQQADE